jgi:small-conductance mechanosensitive channel
LNAIPSFTGTPPIDVALSVILAVAAVLAAHEIGATVLTRVVRLHDLGSTLVAHTHQAVRWVLVFAATSMVLTAALPMLPELAPVRHASSVMLIAAVTWLAFSTVNAFEAIVMRLHPSDRPDNLRARRIATHVHVLGGTVKVFAAIFGVGGALVSFPGVRQYGATILASAGVAGIAAGLAARPVLGNMIAGLQLAFTQPIRIDDVLIVEGEWGRVEEITAAYVVVRIWDERRLIVPLQWFIEHPFQNWTRRTADVIGAVYAWADYGLPVKPVREEFLRLCRAAPEWDGRVAALQVTELGERAMQLRGIASAADAGRSWDLRCRLREGLVEFVRREFPQFLPRFRTEASLVAEAAPAVPRRDAARGARPPRTH